MIASVFKIMWLRLWRDRGALVLAFILPGFIFAIFAAIFSSAAGGQLDLRVSMAVTSQVEEAFEFSKVLQEDDSLSLSYDAAWSEEIIRERVKLGQDDVGIVLFGTFDDPDDPSVRIITDPSRDVAVAILRGHIMEKLAEYSGAELPNLFDEQSALPNTQEAGPKDQSVTYYVGATAILFLLFSAMQGAALTLEERRNGISDRLLLGPNGAIKLLFGKFCFLTVIGTVQAAIIVAVGHIFFDVQVFDKLLPLALACFGAASLASGIALLVASLTESPAQMNTVSTFVVLLASAIGGSMVPRFMMPEWLQTLGHFTPNHWAIEAFYGILARGQSFTDLIPVWSVLFGGAAATVILAAFISHRMMRL